MERRAFLIVAQWPYSMLSDAGKCTSCWTGGTENHLGIFIPCTTAKEREAHSEARVSDPSARGKEHVSFDFMMDRRPRFQSYDNDNYYGSQASVWLYPILDVDASLIHKACLEVARQSPVNHFCYRLNGVCWFWPYPCWCPSVQTIGPSTCVALTLRIIARAKTGFRAPYTSDAATFTALGLNRFGPNHPCEPAALTGYSPRAGLEALQEANVVGRPVEGFEAAISLCRGSGSAPAIGNVYPLLPLSTEMSRW